MYGKINYLSELVNHVGINDFSRVKCISGGYKIEYFMKDDLRDDVVVDAILHPNWNEEDLNVFFEKLRFEAYPGDAIYTFYGTIWYHDGTWSRYDNEWEDWVHNSCARIPKFLRKELS
jgi:hypothetical protein